MSRFMEGDRVIVNHRFEVGKVYDGGCLAVPIMEDVKGKHGVISSVIHYDEGDRYKIIFDDLIGVFSCVFTDSMLEHELVKPITNKELLEYALEKLDMSREELEYKYKESRDPMVTLVKKVQKFKEKTCNNTCCGGCEYFQFQREHNLDGEVDCDTISVVFILKQLGLLKEEI